MALGSMLAGATPALFMANAGRAWDNAKKFIEGGGIELGTLSRIPQALQ